MQGTVRWYSRQGYGFIDPSDGRDAIYFHIRNVVGQEILKPGAVVSFDVAPSPKGHKAVRVTPVVSKTNEECHVYQSQRQHV
jgi:cold shock CspA family protein